jgi:FkbM family methyltransferase
MNTTSISLHTEGNFSRVLNTFFVYTGDSLDKHVQHHCRQSGAWDKQLTEWMISNIQPGFNCLDIGANNFYFSEVMSRLAGPTGKVNSFEPLKYLCDNHAKAMLKNNYEHCSPINIFNTGLSNIDGEKILQVWEENVGGSGIVSESTEGIHDSYGNYHSESIKVNKLSSLLNEKIDFIKMDIEGHEYFAYQGFPDIIKKCPLMVFELGAGQPQEFLDILRKNYVMTFLDGSDAQDSDIRQHNVVNILLRRKND